MKPYHAQSTVPVEDFFRVGVTVLSLEGELHLWMTLFDATIVRGARLRSPVAQDVAGVP